MTAWATLADVKNLTGLDLTGATIALPWGGTTDGDGLIAQAQGVIETFEDVGPDQYPIGTEGLSDADREHFRKATAYQTAWMRGQYDLMTRADATQVAQDGLSFSLSSPDGVVLAPLARRNLNLLSWNKSGPIGTARHQRAVTLEDADELFLRDEACGPGIRWERI